MFRSISTAARRGLTLIELVVVMAILAALAALIIPRLDFLKAQADHATAASNTGDLATLIQTYKTSNSNGKYPTLDLLVDETGAAITSIYSGGGAPIAASTIPGPASGANWYRSMLEGGLAYGITHSSTSTDASNSGSGALVDLVSEAAAGVLKVAELQNAGYYAPAVFKAIFPARIDSATGTSYTAGQYDNTKVKLIAMGIGPNNSMIGNVMEHAPLETDTDVSSSTYCRYIAIFAIYNNGSNTTPAQLKMVVDHRFKQISKHVDQFKSGGLQVNSGL